MDVSSMNDATLANLVRDLERDLLGGVETTFAGEPIVNAWRVASTEQVRRSQRRTFKEMPLESLLSLRDDSTRDHGLDAGGRVQALWQQRMGLLREDVDNEIARRSRAATGGEA